MIISEKTIKKRRRKDIFLKSIILSYSTVGIIIFASILIYLFSKGGSLVSFDLLVSDYQSINSDVVVNLPAGDYQSDVELSVGDFYSSNWDVVLTDTIDKEGNDIVVLSYIGSESPFQDASNLNKVVNASLEEIALPLNGSIDLIILDDYDYIALSKFGAEDMVNIMNQGTSIDSMTIVKEGGGIRGSLITTLLLIGMSLLISVPIGIFSAIYINEYSSNSSKLTNYLKSMIDLLTGVPSIIFGLMGAAVFIPFVNGTMGTSGGSIISGALTMGVILLPVIIKSTGEALKVVPSEIRAASLALGANKTQTTFKTVLPSAIPGILTGVLLGIGRVIGESAALIYAIGASIKDQVIITERSTPLAVHIWTAMSGDKPNFELASAIAIIILGAVIILNITAKLVAKKYNKAWY